MRLYWVFVLCRAQVRWIRGSMIRTRSGNSTAVFLLLVGQASAWEARTVDDRPDAVYRRASQYTLPVPWDEELHGGGEGSCGEHACARLNSSRSR